MYIRKGYHIDCTINTHIVPLCPFWVALYIYIYSTACALRTPEERLLSGAPKEEFGRIIFETKSSLGDCTKVQSTPWAAASGGGAWRWNVRRPMYIRILLQLRLTLACIKALSKTVPNIHGFSHVPAPRLTSTSTCRQRWMYLVRSPRELFVPKIIRPNSSFGTPEGSLSFGEHNAMEVVVIWDLVFEVIVCPSYTCSGIMYI